MVELEQKSGKKEEIMRRDKEEQHSPHHKEQEPECIIRPLVQKFLDGYVPHDAKEVSGISWNPLAPALIAITKQVYIYIYI